MAPIDRPSDEDLMRRIRADDADAFRLLYQRHAASVYAVARTMTAGTRLAEDAAQDAFLTAWRWRARWDPARGSAVGWLLSIARSRALDARRRVSRRPWEPLDGHDVADWAETPDSQAERGEALRAVRAALTVLPPEQATALALAYYGELSHAEIAARLDVPLGTVKGRIRLGLRRLSSELVTA
jgi:RNA polymerase sigma-70 factor (ECF subfamily)